LHKSNLFKLVKFEETLSSMTS